MRPQPRPSPLFRRPPQLPWINSDLVVLDHRPAPGDPLDEASPQRGSPAEAPADLVSEAPTPVPPRPAEPALLWWPVGTGEAGTFPTSAFFWQDAPRINRTEMRNGSAARIPISCGRVVFRTAISSLLTARSVIFDGPSRKPWALVRGLMVIAQPFFQSTERQ